jgi:hypothetical protein
MNRNALSLACAVGLLCTSLFAHAADYGGARASDFPTRPDHIVIVVEENKAFEQIIGNPAARYINELARSGALLTQSYGVAHPSQPNYIALFSGSTHGLSDDSCPHEFTDDNLAADLVRHRLHFAIYAEAMPEAGYTGCAFGRYFRKHNPASNWIGANVSGTLTRPFTDFPSDYAKLPEVSFIIPDIINDMHDDQPPASVAAGDAWLKKNLSGYARWALRHNSLLIVTWDEDDSNHGNRIPTILYGAMVLPGQYDAITNHYDVLRTLTTLFELDALPGLDSTHPITGIWRAPAGQ